MLNFDAACKAVTTAPTIAIVLELRAQADALRIYAKNKKDRATEMDAAEIRIRAERRLGQLLPFRRKRGRG